MNAQVKEAPRAANLSNTITGFELTKRFKDLLAKFDKLYDYQKLAGKTPPLLRLSRVDFRDLDQLVRTQSQGQRQLGSITYRNLPILSAGE
jgi:hypothetical protein